MNSRVAHQAGSSGQAPWNTLKAPRFSAMYSAKLTIAPVAVERVSETPLPKNSDTAACICS